MSAFRYVYKEVNRLGIKRSMNEKQINIMDLANNSSK
jgi:hypothetical protein